MFHFIKNIFLYTFTLLVSLSISAQDYLPKLPSCSEIKIESHININQVLSKLDKGIIENPTAVFCYINKQSKDATSSDKKKREIAQTANEIGNKLHQIAKYQEAIHFHSLSAQLWMTTGNSKKLTKAILKIGKDYHDKGETINAVNYFNIALQQSKKNDDVENLYQTIIALAWVERWTLNLEKEKEYITQVKQLLDKYKIDNSYEYFSLLQSMYRAENKFAVSESYIDSTLFIAKKNKDSARLALAYSNKANIMMHRKSKDKQGIIDKLLFAIKINSQKHNTAQLSSNHGVLGRAYIYNQEYDKAIKTINKGLKYAFDMGNKGEIMVKYWYLQEAYKAKKDYKNAFEYIYKHHVVYQDYYGPNNIQNINNAQRKNEQKLHESELKNIEKEKEIINIKNQRNKQTFWLLFIIASLIFSGLVYAIILQKKSQKRKTKMLKEKLSHELLEMEMEALRARMNPHFLFNSLNSIKSYIATNQPREASDYLTKFAVLVRMMLNHSKEKLISLEENIKALKYYLDIEKMRLKDKFEYTFNIQEDLLIDDIFIPPSILQPYVENAIWHGFSGLDKKGKIQINVYRENEDLFIEIQDNGIGRKKAAENNANPKHRSVGTNIIKKTLEVLKKDTIIDISTQTIDLYSDNKPKGTKVIIQIKAEKDE